MHYKLTEEIIDLNEFYQYCNASPKFGQIIFFFLVLVMIFFKYKKKIYKVFMRLISLYIWLLANYKFDNKGRMLEFDILIDDFLCNLDNDETVEYYKTEKIW